MRKINYKISLYRSAENRLYLPVCGYSRSANGGIKFLVSRFNRKNEENQK